MTAAPRPLAAPGARRDAEAEIERDYERLEAEIVGTVRGKLAAAGARIDDHALAAAYNQAWHALYAARVDGERIENRVGFLVLVTYRRALDDQRAGLHVVADPGDGDEGVDQDLEGQLDDRLRVRALMQGMRERLDARELRAATLCYVHGYTRPEAAEALGVRPRRFEKVMDHVSRELSRLVGELSGDEWCDTRRSLISAYALGMLDTDGERYQLAVAHLDDCPACRRRVLCMRGLAGIAPPTPLLLAALPASGGAATWLAERWSWVARVNGHWTEVGAGGAVVAAAASAVIVLGPPGGNPGPPAAPTVVAAPLPASVATELRAGAARSVARARSEARRRARDRKAARAERPSSSPGPPTRRAVPTTEPATAPVETPPAAPQSAPAPAPPTAAPADDGWEEFELRR